MSDSIFTKIIRGEIPSYKIYEDERTFVFLDIHPITPGHTLVVPKVQKADLWDLEDRDYQAVMKTVKLVSKKLKESLNVNKIGLQVIGVDVPHAHVHLIPFNKVEEYRTIPDESLPVDHKTLAELAKKLNF